MADFDRSVNPTPRGPAVSVPAPPRRDPIFAVAAVGISAAVLLLIWAITFLFSTHRDVATVTSRSWTIVRDLHAREIHHASDWGAPSGSFNQSCASRYYGDERCDPYSCNFRQESYDCRPRECRCQEVPTSKKGVTRRHCDTCYDRCSRQTHETCWHRCPVYRQYCEYDYYTWPVVRSLSTSGSTEPVTEPALEAGENQRVEQREFYEVRFGDKKIEPGRSEFQRYAVGSKWTVETNHFGGFKVIEEAR